MSDTKDNISILDMMHMINTECSYEKLGKMTLEKKEKYNELLDILIESHDNENITQKEKGQALENIASYLFKNTGELFYVKRNIRTSTNEIDNIFSLTQAGKCLLSHGIINSKFDLFLGECKNYSGKVSVTYVGKFCSLLLTCGVNLGIMFSYYGITGDKWSESSGLIKKFYLHTENEKNRKCIIDFNINDFIAIKNGNNLLQIIDDKIDALRLDTDYKPLLSEHPAEDELKQIILKNEL